MKLMPNVATAPLLLLLACVGTIHAGAAQKAGPELSVCQSIVVPSYFHPKPAGSEWDSLIANPPKSGKVNRILIVNPSSGPGKAANADFRLVVEKVHHSGQKAYGYVPTGYGKRSLQSVEQQVAAYVTWYGVDGIFVDEVSDRGALVQPYYQPLSTYITSQIRGGGVILNNGTYPSARYAEIKVPETSTLQLVVFEHDYGAFTAPSYRVPSWIQQHPASMFVGIVYAASREQLPGVLRLAHDRNMGSVYVTDRTLPNPYSKLPTYWQALEQETETGCGK